MSLEQDLQNLADGPEQDFRDSLQGGTKQCALSTSPSGPSFDFEACINSSLDTSFECSMHRENVESFKSMADWLLQECLEGAWDKKAGFRDSSLYKVKSMSLKGQNDLETVVMHNELLTADMVKQLCGLMEKEEGVIGLLREAPGIFGITVTKEIVYVVYHLLKLKLQAFCKLLQSKEPIIPKMNCFMDCEGEFLEPMGTSCPVYEDVSLEEVVTFAEEEVDECARELYFKDIRVLNLRGVNRECKKGVNIAGKFTKLIKQISKSLFLSLIGATEPSSALVGLDLSRQISFAQLSDPGLSAQRSFSRRHVGYDEDESYDFISKKIKFE